MLTRKTIALFLMVSAALFGEATLPDSALISNIVNKSYAALPACPAGDNPGSQPNPITTNVQLKASIEAATYANNNRVICVADNAVLAADKYVLGAKSDATDPTADKSNFIVIRPVTAPAAGRYNPPGNYPTTRNQPQINCIAGSNCISIAATAKRWRITGFDIRPASTISNYLNNMFQFGPADSQNACEWFVLDRNHLHGHNRDYTSKTAYRAASVNCQKVAFVGNYIHSFNGGTFGTADAQGIHIYNSSGGIVIENNYIESSGENIMSGGGSGQVVIPSGFLIRGNYIYKPVSQKGNSQRFFSKNSIEYKVGKDILIVGNWIQNNWTSNDGQHYAITNKSTNQKSIANTFMKTQVESSNITILYNRFDNVSGGFGLHKSTQPLSKGGGHFTLMHNLITKFGFGSAETTAGYVSFINMGLPKADTVNNKGLLAEDIVVEHNTIGSMYQGKKPRLLAIWKTSCNANQQPGCRAKLEWCTHINSTTKKCDTWSNITFPGDTTYGYLNGLTFRSNAMPGFFGDVNTVAGMSAGVFNTYIANSGAGFVGTHNLVGRYPETAPSSSALFQTPKWEAPADFFSIFNSDFSLKAEFAKVGHDGKTVGADIVGLNACIEGVATNWTGHDVAGHTPCTTFGTTTLTTSLSATPTEIDAGGSSTLTWFVGNATSCSWACSAPGGSCSTAGLSTDGANGTASVTPNPTTTYTITCVNGANSRNASVTINVNIDDGPGAPANQAPANEAVDELLQPTLSWLAASGGTQYDVFMDTNPTPTTEVASNITDLVFTPGSALTANTRYYWYVKAENASGSQLGPTWSFTTGTTTPSAPAEPTYTFPANEATGVAHSINLTWDIPARASTFDVYFGTTNPPPQVAEDSADPSYHVEDLTDATTYYWQVVAKNIGGETPGTVVSFTTLTSEVCDVPATMTEVLSAAGEMTANTSPGVQTVTSSLSFSPKLVLWYNTGRTTTNSSGPNYTMGFGAMTATEQFSVWGRKENSGVNARSSESNTQALYITDAAGAVSLAAGFNAFTANGFSINITTAPTTPNILHWVALGGSIETKIIPITSPTTTGTVNYTGSSFQPDAILFFTGGRFNTGIQQYSHMGGGFASSSAQSGWGNNVANTANTHKSAQSKTKAIYLPGPSAMFLEGAVTNLNADGFSINWTTVHTSGVTIYAILIRGVNATVGSVVEPSPAAAQSVTGLGYQPSAILFASTCRPTVTGIAPSALLTVGAIAQSGQFNDHSLAMQGGNFAGQAKWNNQVLSCYFTADGTIFNMNSRAASAGITADGFDLNWDTVDTNPREHYYMTLGPKWQ